MIINFSNNKGLIKSIIGLVAIFISQTATCEPASARPDAQRGQLNAFYNPLLIGSNTGQSGHSITKKLTQVDVGFMSASQVVVNSIPDTASSISGKVVGLAENGKDIVVFSFDKALQDYTNYLVKQSRSPHIAIVAMDPYTGRILSMGGRSRTVADPYLHSGYKAASLFKLITATAAVESKKLDPDHMVKFRGGLYTLNKWNISPDARRDRQTMSVSDALGKSCNPVFARIALQYLDPYLLKRYAQSFGFNHELNFDMKLPNSKATIPSSDYGLGRTAAGFGNVGISPVHAAALVSGIANGGYLPRPMLIDRVVSETGELLYLGHPEVANRIMRPETSQTILEMMESTVKVGTSRREFYAGKAQKLPGISVAAKTGTLSGTNPKGINRWFIATAPVEDPKIALAVIVVDPNRPGLSPSRLGMLLIKRYLTNK